VIQDMPKPRYPHLHREKTRHGAVAWYFRKGGGQRVRIRGEYDSAEFRAAYARAIGGAPAEQPAAAPKTLRWAIDRYRLSSAWAQLANATRRQKENIFRRVIAISGNERLADIDTDAIRAGRERRKDAPHSANVFLKAMRSFFRWALEEGLVASDPTVGIALLKGTNDDVGFHTWTQEEMDAFEARWPLGTRERLAYDLLLYTGLRRGDAVRVGRQHVTSGIIQIRAEKTGEELFLPILPPLQTSIEATATGDLAFLCNAYGDPWVKESFGNWFREVCQKAGVPGSAHGLRKAGATRAAENGATDRGLMALFGWTKEKMATRYTRAADRKRLALAAAEQLLKRGANEKRPHLLPGAGAAPNSSKKTAR
jgi:integrase